MPFNKHLSKASDLVTPRDVTAKGFINMSLERSRRATIYVDEGKNLKTQVSLIPDPADLITQITLHEAILTAAGVSDKAKDYFEAPDRELAIKEFTDNFLVPAKSDFPEELVSRYLLTRGDTLGGSMRNVVGYLAGVKFITSLIAALNVLGQSFKFQDRDSKTWLQYDSTVHLDVERRAFSLSWSVSGQPRTLLQNINVPKVNKNVDICLFACGPECFKNKKLIKQTLNDFTKYIALGELKGGIDPAGADEHWKTARSALQRIRDVKETQDKELFFIGAAIAKAMSDEIWNDLHTVKLANAANLTDDTQTASIATWLVTL